MDVGARQELRQLRLEEPALARGQVDAGRPFRDDHHDARKRMIEGELRRDAVGVAAGGEAMEIEARVDGLALPAAVHAAVPSQPKDPIE